MDVNASDLAAKGGWPVAFLLDLALPPGTPESWARDVVLGARAELRRLGAELVGGDTKPAHARVAVGTFLGRASSDRLAPRSGARPGDLLALTGTVGGPGWAATREPRRGVDERALRSMLTVRPRLEEGRELVRLAHALIDTSDGFAEAARLLAQASRLRLVVEEAALPWDRHLRSSRLAPADRLRMAAYGGEYELLAALPPSAYHRLQARFRQRRLAPLHAIGHVARGSGSWLLRAGRLTELPRSRWRPWG